jgi:hypothetical protein
MLESSNASGEGEEITGCIISMIRMRQIIEHLVVKMVEVASSGPQATGNRRQANAPGCAVSHTVGVAVDAGVGARNFVEHLVGVTLVVSSLIGGAMACR